MNPTGGGCGDRSGAPVIVSAESELYMAWLTQESGMGVPGRSQRVMHGILSVRSRKSSLLDQDDKSTSRLSVERVTMRSGPRALASLTSPSRLVRNPQGSTALRAINRRRAQIAMPRCSLINQAHGKVGSLVAPRDGFFSREVRIALASCSATRGLVRVEHCSCVIMYIR